MTQYRIYFTNGLTVEIDERDFQNLMRDLSKGIHLRTVNFSDNLVISLDNMTHIQKEEVSNTDAVVVPPTPAKVRAKHQEELEKSYQNTDNLLARVKKNLKD